MENCIFCKIIDGVIPSTVIYEDEISKVILDIAPAAKGHAILILKEHAENIFELDEPLAKSVFAVVPKVARAIKETLGCDGMNILQNNGVAAGQTVFHFHIHFIPRWDEDTIRIQWETGSYAEGEAAALAKQIASLLQ